MMTDAKARTAKPKEKAYKLQDRDGLYLFVSKTGVKSWRYDYRYDGKRKTLTIGKYPLVSLVEARGAVLDARKKLSQNKDPNKKTKKGELFENVANRWFDTYSASQSEATQKKHRQRLDAYIIPNIGSAQINEITTAQILDMLRDAERRGFRELAHRLRSMTSSILRFAIAEGLVDYNPADQLKGALKPVKSKRRATVTDEASISALMRALYAYDGHPVVRLALLISAHCFPRSKELRYVSPNSLNLQKREWIIPADLMKMKEKHIIPLSAQSAELLAELKPYSNEYLFPGIRKSRPMSENTLNNALAQCGFGRGRFTHHGFRSMASTRLNEIGYNRDWIERQLAHSERDDVRAAYNYAEYLQGRREMMQAWSDYLTSLL